MKKRPEHTGCPKRMALPCGVELSEMNYPADLVMDYHSHSYGNITIHYAGDVAEAVGSVEHRASTCSVVAKPAGTRHRDCFGPAGARTVKVVPGGSWFADYPELAGVMETYSWHHSGAVSSLGLRLCREFLLGPGDATSSLALESLLVEFLAEIDRAGRDRSARCPAWVDAVTEYVHAHFLEPLRVAEIARAVDLHPVYVARAFRRRHGCTLGEYARRLRLEWAARRLTSTNAPLAEIALEAGFSDQSHFTRHFRSTLGFAPGQFRQTTRR